MIILVDTREQENSHIIQFFDAKKIPWELQKLDCCDYSAKIPRNQELGIMRDIYFDKIVAVERKANLEEISKNYSAERSRISKEFSNAPHNKVLLIENSSYEMLVEGTYNTSYNPKSFWATMLTMWHRYNVPVMFIQDKKYSGQFIYGYLRYFVYNLLKE